MTGLDILDFAPVNGTDEDKAKEIAESIKKNGWQGAPILTYGNCLITGSHRLRAIQLLFEEDYDISFECANDVTDILEEKGFEDKIFDYTDGGLRYIFEGTWVEDYADGIEEWY